MANEPVGVGHTVPRFRRFACHQIFFYLRFPVFMVEDFVEVEAPTEIMTMHPSIFFILLTSVGLGGNLPLKTRAVGYIIHRSTSADVCKFNNG